jgi:hypothetical protein
VTSCSSSQRASSSAGTVRRGENVIPMLSGSPWNASGTGPKYP